MGISFAPSIWAVSNSQGSRTSSKVKRSLASSLRLTSSGVISYSIDRGCEKLPPSPLRFALVHEGADSLVCIFGLQEFVQINPFRAGQSLVEMHRIPSVRRLLGQCQSRRAKFPQMCNAFIDDRGQFILGYSTIRQTELRRLFAADCPPSQNQLRCALLSSQES